MKKILPLVLLVSAIFSQTDKMYIGDLNESVVNTKMKTIEHIPRSNSYIIYGKYNSVNWENGEINFVGNNGIVYSDPSLVQAIKNEEGLPHLQTPVLNTLRGKKQELARKQLQTECENNKSISVMVLPIKDDFYGLTEDIEQTMATDGCFNILPNENGLEYLHQNNIYLENINDFLIRKLGEFVGADYIIYGYAGEYDVPFKYSAAGSDRSIQRVAAYNSNQWMNDLLISINNWVVVDSEMSMRSAASIAAGSYITLTYYSIDISNGEKKYLTKNRTVMKKG